MEARKKYPQLEDWEAFSHSFAPFSLKEIEPLVTEASHSLSPPGPIPERRKKFVFVSFLM